MAVFKGQSLLDIILDTEIPLVNNRKLSIKYLKPNGERGEWPGTKEGDTSVKYSIGNRDLDQAGLWRIQAAVITADWKRGYGEIVDLNVLSPL